MSSEDEWIASARAFEPDRLIAATMARAGDQRDLVILAAFAAELTRAGEARDERSELARLTWWLETIQSPPPQPDHPLAAALLAMIGTRRLALADFERVLTGRLEAVEEGPPADLGALCQRMVVTEGGLFRLALTLAGAAADAATERIAAAAGTAYGIARALHALAAQPSRNRMIPTAILAAQRIEYPALAAADPERRIAVLFPLAAAAEEALAEVRQLGPPLARSERAALLPLVMVRPYLRAQQRAAEQAVWAAPRMVPIARFARLALAHALGRW